MFSRILKEAFIILLLFALSFVTGSVIWIAWKYIQVLTA